MSDTHDRHDKVRKSSPQYDVLLHCGDIAEDGLPQSIKTALDAFSKVDAELKLFIAGNHDIALVNHYYLFEGGTEENHLKARSLLSTPSIRFLEEGTHEFTLKSGAHFKIYISPFTPKYGASPFQYPSNEDRFNEAENTPSWAKDVGSESSVIPSGAGVDIMGAMGCEHLRRAISRVRPRLHCFGHVHTGYGARRVRYDDKRRGGDDLDRMDPLPQEWVGKNQMKRKGYASLPPGSAEAFKKNAGETLAVNAAVVDGEGKPEDRPWLVELDLPKWNT
ncbi:ser/Thr protein phosphatase family protein [Bimuria novae-zelandiae CBS 107.79]|uniref:Ser/Thr protein phosphatase family protein n=1 Tax=Bimuria novae-zelandiae CBS 107.79 TaxID=1447943 RepID=A0A6A5VEA7_9PLEO|nr:ser/Thr protein phosphatase family protein [Bimuria novae-zelandiae CBS 107.79]